MLSGITGWDDVPLAQKDITAAMAAVMRGTGENTIAINDLASLQEQLKQNEALLPLPETTSGFVREQWEMKVTNAKTEILRSHIAEEGTVLTRLSEELVSKQSLLADSRTSLKQCQDLEQPLTAEAQRLANAVAALQTEQMEIPGQLASLLQQITADQLTLKATIVQHKQAEKKLLQLQNAFAIVTRTHDTYAALLIKAPKNKIFLRAHELAEKLMVNLETQMKPYRDTVAGCQTREGELTASIAAHKQETDTLQERLSFIPSELQQAQDQQAAAEVALQSNRTEQTRLQTETENRQSAVDTAFASESEAAADLQQDNNDLAGFVLQEQSESADVQAMYEAVNVAIAQVLAEGDPALPDIDPDPDVIPQEKTDAPALGTAVRENEWTKLSLPVIGGEVLLRSWQGEATGSVSVETVTGDAIRHTVIAASLTANTISQAPSLANELDLVTGVQPDPAMGFALYLTRNVPDIGNVFVLTDTITPYYPGKPLERFVVNTQGVVASSSIAYIGPTLTLLDPGKGKVEVAFPDGPQYMQWIDVRHLSGEKGGVITITHPDGSTSQIPFNSDGPVVIDDVITKFVMQPRSEAAYGIKAMECEEPQVNVDPGASWLQSRGELVGIDVSQTGKAVDQVSLHVLSDRPSSTLTAVAYRGNTRIASMTVGPDGLINFADAQGITSILCIQSDPNATLTITGLNVQALDPSVPPPSTGLTPLENPDVAFHSSTITETESFNFIDVAQRAGVKFNRGGYENTVNGSVLFYNGGAHDPNSYTMHKPLSTNGSVSLGTPMYVTPTGLKPVPSTHWQAIGNGFVLFPGAPPYVVDSVSGHGTFDIAVTSGVSPVEVMPSEDMDLKTSVLVIRPIGPAEGWGDMPACVSSENAHATAGGTVNMYYQVMNDGLGSGQVTARVHVGQTGTAADPVVREFTTTLNGLANKALSVNVTLGADNDRITLEVIGPDGQSSIASKQVRPPHGDGGYTDEQRAFIMTEGRGVRIAARIYDVIAHSTDGRIVAYRNATEAEILRVAALAEAEKAAELAKKEEEEEKIAEEIAKKLGEEEDLGIGGDASVRFTWNPETGTIIDEGDIPLYNPSGYIPEGVNLSSGWGKIFVGFVQRLLPHANLMASHPTGQEARGIAWDPNFDSFYNYIRLASDEIGIPWDRILDAADLPPTVANQATAQAELVSNLKAVFIQNGHGEIFEAKEVPVQDLSTLPDTLENRGKRERENVILTQIASRLPINQSAGTWEQTLGSPFHIAGRTLNAVDFNLNTGKDTDYGKPVLIVANGTIESIDANNGGVTIRHTMMVNGKEETWRSKYLHMPMETESGENGTEYFIRVREQNPEKPGTFDGPVKDGNWCKVSIGQQLQAGALLGYVGKLSEGKEGGTDGTMKAHLHFEATDAIFGEVNMANVLTRLGIRTYAMGPDEVPNPDHPGSLTKNPTVTWDDVIDEWVIAEQGVIFSREAAGSGLDNVWAAWTENISDRRRVGWDNDVQRWLQWDSEKNSWFRDADNRRLLWQDYSWLAE